MYLLEESDFSVRDMKEISHRICLRGQSAGSHASFMISMWRCGDEEDRRFRAEYAEDAETSLLRFHVCGKFLRGGARPPGFHFLLIGTEPHA